MKSLLIIASCIILSVTAAHSKTYYVSSSGANTNTGLTADSAWRTLSYAAGISSPVTAGDTVYVKAGNYGAENVVFLKSGSIDKLIYFIGYKKNAGDNPPVMTRKLNPFSAFLSTDMPLFDGGNRDIGIGFDCKKQKYLVIKNFNIRNYEYGFVAGGKTQDAGNLTLHNVNVMYCGNVNASYSGEGILFGSMGTELSNNNTINYCLVVNASAEGIGINGNNNSLKGCEVYCNENTTNYASTDYYVVVCGSNNVVDKCNVDRMAGLWHAGHGMGVKSNAEQIVDRKDNLPAINPTKNKFTNCTAKNMGESFYVRHRGCQDNLFYHCKATGTHTGAANSPQGEGNCIVTRDGASNNTFDGCIAENCAAGFVFVDTQEDGDVGINPIGHPGNGNKYVNCLIINCYMGINFSSYGVQSDAGDNTVSNCTFFKTRYLHLASRHCSNMKYVNNIYYGCLPAKTGGYLYGGAFAADITPDKFKKCCMVNIQNMPIGFVQKADSCISLDPVFLDAIKLDLHISATSPCKDAGVDTPYNKIDLQRIRRPQGKKYDIGAYELK